MVKNCGNLLAVLTALLMSAHPIDYIGTDIQPQVIFTGRSGHFQVIDPIAPGSTITFNLTLKLILSVGGSTTALPATVGFGVKNTGGSYDPSLVKFGTPETTLTDTVTYTYDKNKTFSFMTPVTAKAPMEPGSYHFNIQAINGFHGNGFTPGDGIVIHFKVAEPVETM